MKKLLGMLAVISGASLYGGLNSIIKLAYQAGYSFSQITFSQYFFGSVLLIFLVFITKSHKKLNKDQFLHISIVGVVGLGGTSLFLYGSLQQVATSIALVLLFQFTWISLLIEKFIFKKTITWSQIISVIIILIGTLSVLQIFALTSKHLSLIGIVYGFLAALCYSIFLIGASVLPHDIPGVYKTAIMSIVTFAVLSIGFMSTVPIHILNPFNSIWVWGLILGIFGQILPPLLFNYGAPIIGGSITSILGTVELPIGVLLSTLLVNEKVTPIQWLGVFLIFSGMIVGSWAKSATEDI